MQMFLSQAEKISQQNDFAICAVAYAEVELIDTREIAATAAIVLTNDSYKGKNLRLKGRELLKFPAAVEALNKAIERTINYYKMDCTEYREIMLKVGIPEFLADHVIGLYSRIGTGGSAVTTDNAAIVTEKFPRYFKTFATDYAGHFRYLKTQILSATIRSRMRAQQNQITTQHSITKKHQTIQKGPNKLTSLLTFSTRYEALLA